MDSFSFHYVKTPTGEISGASFMQQTEDVINDLGKFATESTQDSTEALRIAKEAMSTADTANANAATALATSNSAISVAKSLQLVPLRRSRPHRPQRRTRRKHWVPRTPRSPRRTRLSSQQTLPSRPRTLRPRFRSKPAIRPTPQSRLQGRLLWMSPLTWRS